MANIYDYLSWRGDLTLEERPFNDVDNLICSVFSYLNFTGILGEGAATHMTIREAFDRLLSNLAAGETEGFCTLAKIEPRFATLSAQSRRFGEAVLHDYVDVYDKERLLQFSAVTIDLTPDISYVAFRGTDATLVGWREDFMISFSVTAAQEEAAAYLARVVDSLFAQGRRVYVGGHSKGGNLAAYAAVSLPSEQRDGLACVWSNDGPGFAPEVEAENPTKVLGERYVRILPAYSIVGMLFERPGDTSIVCKSTATGVQQHDPTTWQVLADGMDKARGLLPECMVVDAAIASWANELDFEQRAMFTHEIFDALEAGGAERLSEVAESPSKLQKVLVALGKIDAGAREPALQLVNTVLNSSVGAARVAAVEVAGLAKNAFSKMTKAVRGAREGEHVPQALPAAQEQEE